MINIINYLYRAVVIIVFFHIPLSVGYWAFDLAQSTYRKRKTNKALEKYAKENYEFLKEGSLFHELGVKLQLSDKQKITMLIAMLEEKEDKK